MGRSQGAEWPHNVDSWGVERRWEAVFDGMLAVGVSYEEICRAWPMVIRFSERYVEELFNFHREDYKILAVRGFIQDVLEGIATGTVPPEHRPWQFQLKSRVESGVLVDPWAAVKAIPIHKRPGNVESGVSAAREAAPGYKHCFEQAVSDDVASQEASLPGGSPASTLEGLGAGSRDSTDTLFSDLLGDVGTSTPDFHGAGHLQPEPPSLLLRDSQPSEDLLDRRSMTQARHRHPYLLC